MYLTGEFLLLGKTGTLAEVTTGGLIKVESYQSSSATPTRTIIQDYYNLQNFASIDETGRLHVSTAAPAPPDTTSISNTQKSNMTGTVDSFTIIPSGHYIQLTLFQAGSEYDSVAGSNAEIYYAPNGTTTGIELIAAIYVNGSSNQFDITYITPEGDGTKSILLRRRRLGGGAKEIFAKWGGYY